MIALIITAAIILIIAAVIGLIFVIIKWGTSQPSNKPYHPWIFEAPERRVGRLGEQQATHIISSVLREDDRLFTNVQVIYKDKPAELDNVIVNRFGVFIIEVKNYHGSLVGNEDDYEWTKYHTTDAGNTYSKIVKNPIKQVKRQVYVLAKFLEYYGTVRVWIEGYALLLHGNSPVESDYILSSIQDIDKAIHTPNRNRLTQKNIEEISKLLS